MENHLLPIAELMVGLDHSLAAEAVCRIGRGGKIEGDRCPASGSGQFKGAGGGIHAPDKVAATRDQPADGDSRRVDRHVLKTADRGPAVAVIGDDSTVRQAVGRHAHVGLLVSLA